MKKIKLPSIKTTLLFLALVIGASVISFQQPVKATPWMMIFPILGGGSYSDDFNAARSNGKHYATDIFAPKHQPIISPVDGTIYYVVNPQASWGYSVGIRDNDGYEYNFIHMNNDIPGTDNSAGGPMNAYAYDMKAGNKVVRGQHLGWVGDSGNAETTPPHLHFEIYDPEGNPVNPYWFLNPAQRINHTVMHPQLSGEILPYGAGVWASLELAGGNLFGNTDREVVVAPGRGSAPNVKVLNSSSTAFISDFMAYSQSYLGGVTVATGDFNNDGIDEIVTGTGPGSSTHVKIFGANGVEQASFMAYPGFNSGVTVATGDFNNDGIDEIVTGTGPGSSTHVKIFGANGVEQSNFFAYPGNNVGLDIAVGDVVGNTTPEIVTSPGPNGGSNVKVFKQNGEIISSFMVYEAFYGGTRLDVANVINSSSKNEIITSPWTRGGPDIRAYNYSGGFLRSKSTYETWWSGRFDIAPSTDDNVWVGTGDTRRSSMRKISF